MDTSTTSKCVQMIQSKDDYHFYLDADKAAYGRTYPIPLGTKMKLYFKGDIYRFVSLLRKTEYHLNCNKSGLGRAYAEYLWYRLIKAGRKLGFDISPNCFGPGLCIVHQGTIGVHHMARIGANCRIFPCVIIGTAESQIRSCKVPTIGNNVFIAPGAKIFGDITIADGIVIGANAVVNKSFLEPNITIAGVPARKISNNGSSDLLVNATEIVQARVRADNSA